MLTSKHGNVKFNALCQVFNIRLVQVTDNLMTYLYQCANSDQMGNKAETWGGTINEGGHGENDAGGLKTLYMSSNT